MTGHVQGVWFRQSTRQQAQQLNLCGWVKNLSDGSVEGIATGEEPNLLGLQAWLKKGPDMAEVAKLDWQQVAQQEFATFEIMP